MIEGLDIGASQHEAAAWAAKAVSPLPCQHDATLPVSSLPFIREKGWKAMSALDRLTDAEVERLEGQYGRAAIQTAYDLLEKGRGCEESNLVASARDILKSALEPVEGYEEAMGEAKEAMEVGERRHAAKLEELLVVMDEAFALFHNNHVRHYWSVTMGESSYYERVVKAYRNGNRFVRALVGK